MQSAMASTLVLNVIILDFIELLNQVAKKTQDDCGRRFFCHAPNLDTDDGDPTGPITISISYSSENLTTAHSAPGLLLSKIHIHPPTNPESRNQANQSTAELIITTQPSPILLSIPKKHQRPFATVDKQEDNEFHQFTPQVSFEKSKMRNDLLLSTPPTVIPEGIQENTMQSSNRNQL